MNHQELRFFHEGNELLITNTTNEKLEGAKKRTIKQLFKDLCRSIHELGSIQIEMNLSSFISTPQMKTVNIFFSIPEKNFYSFAHYQKATSSYSIIVDLLFEWCSNPEILEGVIDFFSPEELDWEDKSRPQNRKKNLNNNSPLPTLDMEKLMREIRDHKKSQWHLISCF